MPYWFMKFVNYVIAFVSTFQLIFNVHPVDKAPGEKIDDTEWVLKECNKNYVIFEAGDVSKKITRE